MADSLVASKNLLNSGFKHFRENKSLQGPKFEGTSEGIPSFCIYLLLDMMH